MAKGRKRKSAQEAGERYKKGIEKTDGDTWKNAALGSQTDYTSGVGDTIGVQNKCALEVEKKSGYDALQAYGACMKREMTGSA